MIRYQQTHTPSLRCSAETTVYFQVTHILNPHSILATRHERFQAKRVRAEQVLEGQVCSDGETMWQIVSPGFTSGNTKADNRTGRPSRPSQQPSALTTR